MEFIKKAAANREIIQPKEVHHKKPVSFLMQEKKVAPKEDVAVVCANCHRMIHRRKDKVLTIKQLRKILEQD